MNYTDKINLISVPIEPNIDSIKEIVVDGILFEKYKYNGKQWVKSCLAKECEQIPLQNYLCEKHNIIHSEGEIIYKINRFRFMNNEWELVCKNPCCDLKATKSGFCKVHNQKSNNYYSTSQNFAMIYKTLKQNLDIEKKNSQKEKRPNNQDNVNIQNV